MKLQSKVFFLSCAVISSLGVQQRRPAFAEPYPEDKYPVADEIVKRKITPPKAPLPIDDYLIALAKTGDVNFIVDVTDIPQEQQVQPFPTTPMAKYFHWEPEFHLTILDLTQQSRMSLLRYDPTTFLFWKEPDAAQLAHQLVDETEPNPDKRLPTAIDLYHIVTKDKDLLKDFSKEGRVIDIPIQEMPPEQRDKALATIRQLFITKEIFARAWFSDAFWNDATIHLASGHPVDKTIPILQVLGSYHQITIGADILGLQAPDETAVKPAPEH